MRKDWPVKAHVPDESSGADRGHRFFHRADGDLSGPVRLRRAIAEATPGAASAVPNAFSLGQRRPGAQGSGTAGTGSRGSDSTGRGITPPISTTRRLAGASQLHRCLPC